MGVYFCHVYEPERNEKRAVWGDCHDESPRKDTRDPPGRTGEPGTRSQVTEVRTSIQVFHL